MILQRMRPALKPDPLVQLESNGGFGEGSLRPSCLPKILAQGRSLTYYRIPPSWHLPPCYEKPNQPVCEHQRSYL